MADRPNIVFIMTDHTNAEVVSPDSPCIKPNLDKLATEGLRFAKCHTTNAICSPARASLMTALYPSKHGMWDCTHTQRGEWVDVPKGRFQYFSEVLAENGYSNGYFGKWHVEQSNKLDDFGWQEYDCKCSGAKKDIIPGTQLIVSQEGYRDCVLAAENKDEACESHPAFDKGIDFIQRHAGGDKPFCCFISTIEPHDAYVAPYRFLSKYDIPETNLSASLHDECRDKPEVVRRMQKVWKCLSDDDWRRMVASYMAVVSFLDQEVGRVLDVLDREGLSENTIVVFTSDHGDMLGSHGLATKGVGTSYEEVYNIPLIVRIPDAARQGEEEDSMVSLADLGPTLLDLCGLPAMEDVHGRSLAPILRGRSDAADWVDGYAEFFGQRFVYSQRIIWHKDWKYVFNPGGRDELYNLAEDPRERNNLADSEDLQGVVRKMLKQMWGKMKEIGDDSLFNTHYATLRTAAVGPLSIEEEAIDA